MPVSRLAPLAPIAAGTVWAESLASYRTRLARVHQRRERDIMKLALAAAQRSTRNLYGSAVRGPVTADVVRGLQALTGQGDLSGSTFLRLEPDIAVAKDIRRQDWSCAQCLRSDEQPYLRLVWTLISFDSCPIHGIRLHHCLPNPRARPGAGQCRRCGSREADERGSSATAEVIVEVMQVAAQAGFPRARLAGALRIFAEREGINKLAWRINLSVQGLSAIIAGRARPSIPSLVKFRSLAPLQELVRAAPIPLEPLREQRTGPPRFDREAAAARLRPLLSLPSADMPSSAEAARLVGLTRLTLSRHFGPEVQILVRGGRLARAARSERGRRQTMERNRGLIEEAFAALVREGHPPTQNAIATRTEMNWLFFDQQNRDLHAALMARLPAQRRET